MLHARMAPSDHARADQAQHVSESVPRQIGSIAAALPSHDLAPPMPPSPPSGEPEMAMVAAKRWGTTQVTDGSVPSPGIGH
nr:unnamed protein product [Digitaria exilis]